jgi:3-phenylpropionate/cinnamic acid dioxygenase small subunit
MKLSAEDRTEIHDLIARYCHAVDFRDTQAWAETFAVDGQYCRPPRAAVVGRPALAEFAKRGGATRHLLTNIVVDETPGGAMARCYFMLYAPVARDQAFEVKATGRYIDELVKTDEGWRFAKREAVVDTAAVEPREKAPEFAS